MKAILAKTNPTVIEQAIRHYERQRKATPDFTFMSLWNDDEPFPLVELIHVLEAQLAGLEAKFKADFIIDRESSQTTLFTTQRKIKEMKQILKRR